jgi:ATP-dependent Clp protease ATP-binding subunit ClpX
MFVLGRKKPETSLLCRYTAHICDKIDEQAHGIVLEEIKTKAYK